MLSELYHWFKSLLNNTKPIALLFGLSAIAVFTTGVVISAQQWHSNQLTTKHVVKLIYDANHNISHIVPATVKTPPSAFASYTVTANYPRYIFIPAIRVQAIIGEVGLTSGGQLGTPDNVYDTDWYDGSSLPGQPGAMVVDGHVSSWTTDGVFYNLKLLTIGDLIKIETGNGTIFSYQVVSKQIYSYQNVDMNSVLSAFTPNQPGLNLITCTGDVISGTNEFNQRIVIYASEV